MQRNLGWLTGRPAIGGRAYQRWLALDEASRPANFRRAHFTANHDMPHVAEAARTSPLGEAVSFVHAFSQGFPFITWSELEGRAAFFAALLAARQGLNGYEASYTAAQSDHADVFAALWTKHDAPALLAVANLSDAPLETVISLPHTPTSPTQRYGSAGISLAAQTSALAITLPAGAYALVAV
jgi:hypothetical protein